MCCGILACLSEQEGRAQCSLFHWPPEWPGEEEKDEESHIRTIKMCVHEHLFLCLPFPQLALGKLMSPLGSLAYLRCWAEILMSMCSQMCLESHRFLLLSLSRIKVSEEETWAICRHPKCVAPDLLQQAKRSSVQAPWLWSSPGSG